MSKSISQTDLEDYEAIKKHLPLATPKQVKWIKKMFDMARSLGYQEPIAEKYLSLCSRSDDLNRDLFLSGAILFEVRGEFKHEYKLQILAGIKSKMALELKKRRKKYEPKAQMSLFHPEAFDEG